MDTSERILLALGDIKEDIGAMGADIRALQREVVELKAALSEHAKEDDKVASRVSSLEHDRSRAKGVAVAISAGVSALFAAGVAIAKVYPWGHS
jgi:chromosome segregation ATPase